MTGRQESDRLAERLRHIEGDVRGIERRIDADRFGVEILTQIAAVRAALVQVGAAVLERHVTHCIANALATAETGAASALSAELLDAVQRFVRAP